MGQDFSSHKIHTSRPTVHLIDAHARHVQHFRTALHGAERKPAAVLPLRQVQHREAGGILVALGVVGLDGFDALQVLFSELEGDVGVVVRGVTVHKQFVGGRDARGGERAREGRERAARAQSAGYRST
jgi:hypothetical protein